MPSPSPTRVAAYHALLAIDAGRRDLPDALARARAALTDERDRALTAEIVTGTLRWQGQLDTLIEHFGRRPPRRLDPEVLTILRLTAYQLLHLARVPASAATNDAVILARHARKSSAASFVNAVLRALLRGRHALPLPGRPSVMTSGGGTIDGATRVEALDYLSMTLSHPRWLAARWLDRYGLDAAVRWEQFNNAPAPLTLRANTLATTVDLLARELRAHGVVTKPARFAPDGLVVVEGNPLQTPLAPRGAFFVQDEASQLVALLAGPAAGARVLDCCASPGGKTVAMAGTMGDSGLIVAGDVRDRRLALLRQTVERSHARSVRVVQFDASAPLPFGRGAFDLVLIDAPCSGLGTIRRDPEIRWRRREADLARFAAAQRTLLDRGAAAVRPGGRIVYATCSSEPEENDEVVEAFVRAYPDFSIADPRAETRPAGLAAVLDRRGLLRTSPVAHGLEAFFGAVLRRVGTHA